MRLITLLTINELNHQGQGYRSIYSARKAINNIIYIPEFSYISQHPSIKRLIKGILYLKTPQLKYTEI